MMTLPIPKRSMGDLFFFFNQWDIFMWNNKEFVKFFLCSSFNYVMQSVKSFILSIFFK